MAHFKDALSPLKLNGEADFYTICHHMCTHGEELQNLGYIDPSSPRKLKWGSCRSRHFVIMCSLLIDLSHNWCIQVMSVQILKYHITENEAEL